MFGQTPEILEKEIGECLETRALSLPGFRGLGPADLVQLTKLTKSKTSSTYHCVTGVDVSSAAAIAAYLTTLTIPLGETQLWSGRAPGWKVVAGTYCCWNAFSKIDVRVSANFPGTTKVYLLTNDGLPQDGGSEDEELWRELYMSAMTRCLLLKDDVSYFMENTRHEYPFDLAGVKYFLSSFEALYYKAPLLGANADVQNASYDCNYMVDALFVMLNVTGEYQAAIDMLGRLDAKEVLAKVLLLMNQEVNAISLMVNTVRKDPRNARMLVMEAEFCLAKHQLELALDCAKRAVSAAPADFYTWEMLCKVYIELEQWDQALLSLNAAPLIPLYPMDVQRFAVPKEAHLPLPNDGVLEEVWEYKSESPYGASADSGLGRLPALNLRGAATKAYALLAAINAKVGWSKLMVLRGEVFWMESESVNEAERKAEEETSSREGDAADTKDVSVGSESSQNDPASDHEAENGKPRGENGASSDTSGDNASEEGKTSDDNASEDKASSTDKTGTDGASTDKASADGVNANSAGAENTNQVRATTGLEGETHAKPQAVGKKPRDETRRRTLRSKRICERKVDRLFLVLYEDFRAYSSWQREAVYFESQKLPFNKTPTEWHLFGALAQRLHHHEPAKHAFQKSLSIRFSPFALSKELIYYPLSLEICVKLMAWDHRWWNEFSPAMSSMLREIVARDGLTKVRFKVEADFGKQSVVDLVKIYLERLKALQVKGFDM